MSGARARGLTRAGIPLANSHTRAAETHRRETIADLQRLVEALDRRVPRLERVGEAEIATDAAELRQQAVGLITTLTSEAPASK
jgi:hypothetical protein